MGGIMLESDYPYTGGSPACAFNIEKSVTQPVGIWTSKGEAAMIERIFQQVRTMTREIQARSSPQRAPSEPPTSPQAPQRRLRPG